MVGVGVGVGVGARGVLAGLGHGWVCVCRLSFDTVYQLFTNCPNVLTNHHLSFFVVVAWELSVIFTIIC